MKKQNIKKACHAEKLLLSISRFLGCCRFTTTNNKKEGGPEQKHLRTTTLFNNGFTLIELLVVVLIIGVLVAIALPQYQKAVWKTKNAQLKVLAKSYLDAQHSYYLANGEYAKSFADLDIQMPSWSSRPDSSSSSSFCGVTSSGEEDSVRYNDEIQMTITSSGSMIIAWRSGPYRCGGFYAVPSSRAIQCAERTSQASFSAHTFCEKIEAATYRDTPSTWRFYILP
ncbi:MAG: prepilin-type N-terminal cleavage/methylation domain-containing protein [Elusimicrobiaceae bacterium]|nr:prepilin-type N-terminal cleavage/methylation domain-containing protein [Elusimicrobiaceae bacterium]